MATAIVDEQARWKFTIAIGAINSAARGVAHTAANHNRCNQPREVSKLRQGNRRNAGGKSIGAKREKLAGI
jgi:hypothetical protein